MTTRHEPFSASALIPHFSRLRAIREHYSQLESAKFGANWGKLELLDGTKGDIGDLAKLETGRRGLRDKYTPQAIAHEVVDCAWSLVVSADSTGVDAATACTEADRMGKLIGTPRQCINRLALAIGLIDEAVDPPRAPALGADHRPLVELYAEGFRAISALAEAYDIHLPEAIRDNMDMLERRIGDELAGRA